MHSSGTNGRSKSCLNISEVEPRFSSTKLAAAIIRGVLMLAVIFALVMIAAQPAQAQTETVIYNFCSQPGCTDGLDPTGNLILDSAGNLYGTSVLGGNGCPTNPSGCGVVFELSPEGGGGWTQTVLYSFSSVVTGANPILAPLVFDSAGNLYGTTDYGGSDNVGVVFELSPSGSSWTQAVLNSMVYGGAGGKQPEAGLILDAQGNLYGTTTSGGRYNRKRCPTRFGGCGVVFELTPSQGGTWTETVLHTFKGSLDGGIPQAAPILDAQGNLYGTTAVGGANNSGIVWKLTPITKGKKKGQWKEQILHTFKGGTTDGASPWAGLIADAQGNFYGTTQEGGAYGSGTIFELTPKNGSWTETILYTFTGGWDGGLPTSPLVFDNAGNLYGTTAAGGSGSCSGGCGVVFELTPSQGGAWTETVLHSFAGTPDGAVSWSGLIFDTQGNLYGMTREGGLSNSGVVFEVTP